MIPVPVPSPLASREISRACLAICHFSRSWFGFYLAFVNFLSVFTNVFFSKKVFGKYRTTLYCFCCNPWNARNIKFGIIVEDSRRRRLTETC